MQPTPIQITVQTAKESIWSILATCATVGSAIATFIVAVLTYRQSRISSRQLEEAAESMLRPLLVGGVFYFISA